MKPSTMLLVTSAGLLSLSAAPHAVLARAAHLAEDKYSDFTKELAPLIGLSAFDEIIKLLKKYQEEAVIHVDLLAGRMATGNNDQLEREFQVMSRCWKEAFKSSFVEKMYEYHSLIDPTQRRERDGLVQRYREALDKFEKNRAGAKDGPVFELAGNEFDGLSKEFARLGDHFYAARCASGAGICFDATYRGNQADLKRACAAFGKVVEHFDKFDLKYKLYFECQARFEALVRDGYGPTPEPDPNAPAPPEGTTPTAQPNAAIVTTTSFAALKSLEEIQRPNFYADELYAAWPVINLGAKGSSGSFQSLERGPLVMRPDAAKVGVDANGDGTPEKSFGLTGNATTVEFELGDGEERRKWAFVFKTGIQDDNYQGVKTNLAPDDKQMRFYVMNAASVTTTLAGAPVRIIDDNMDGVYGSVPRPFAYAGLTENVYQPEFDCIVIGESKRARPWSQYQEIGGAWYDLASEKSGTLLRATPVQLETGTLRLEFKGPAPTWLIVRGTGKLEHAYFDIVDPAKKGVTVPTGTYELFAGELRSGKKAQTMKCLILPSSDMKKWTVAKGAETVVQLGGPFAFEFKREVGEEKFTVKGKSVTVIGAAKERYERTWNCVPRPEVSWRRSGSKKGSKPEKMDIVQDLLEQNEDGSYRYGEADTWRPIDTAFEFKKGESIEVQLVEKKNKLFGEIASDWN
jgi:hypothetical protein